MVILELGRFRCLLGSLLFLLTVQGYIFSKMVLCDFLISPTARFKHWLDNMEVLQLQMEWGHRPQFIRLRIVWCMTQSEIFYGFRVLRAAV